MKAKQIPTEQELTSLARNSLDQSVEQLDAASLSRLNQARQAALASAPQSRLRQLWIPAGAAGFAGLALAIALPLLQPAPPPVEPLSDVDTAYQSTAQDLELVEDLDLVLWLMDAEDHAS